MPAVRQAPQHSNTPALQHSNTPTPPLFALPTEAQWEYACRAGTQTPYSFGDDANELGDHAWYYPNHADTKHAVGQKKPNQWGLYDMHGNAWEWCEDWYGPYPTGDLTDPTGPDTGTDRVLRGGSGWNPAPLLRSARRQFEKPSHVTHTVGFRLVLNVPLTLARPATAGGGPPGALPPAFEVPTEAKDQHGNPVRLGRDDKTGLPLEIRHKTTGMHLVLIPEGEFLMGCPEGERGRVSENESPQHKVRLTRPFYLGKYEVTQAEWQKVMPENPSKFKGDRKPVEGVSWTECDEFVKKLNDGVRSGDLPQGDLQGAGREPAKAGYYKLALPTEAQWEYACRAGTQTLFHCSNDPAKYGLREHAWYVQTSRGQTHEVGSRKPNAWGLYDMHGNVWEWCRDRWGTYPAGDVSDPAGPEAGAHRVLRGGGWDHEWPYCRSAHRIGNSPNWRNHYLGCRVALNIPLTSAAVPAADAGGLPQPLGAAFEVPTQANDQYGNPVRAGRDEETGLPLEIRHKQTGMHLVFIPAGEFLMGSPEGEKGRDAEREGTQHKVRLTKPFYLGKYEVTQVEWQRVTGGNPGQYKGDRNPIENVTWTQCDEFTKRLNAQSPVPGSQFRLPTEAQWEYACRAGTQTRFYYGDDPDSEALKDYAWFKMNAGGRSRPVGGKKPNAWGLYDMHGSVWEWCQDRWGVHPGGEATDPTGPEAGDDRVHRGGSWHDPGEGCRSAARYGGDGRTYRLTRVGCRVALRIP